MISTNKEDLRAFLKFLSLFKIVAFYLRDELWGLLFIISSSEQNPELCQSLGFFPYIWGYDYAMEIPYITNDHVLYAKKK